MRVDVSFAGTAVIQSVVDCSKLKQNTFVVQAKLTKVEIEKRYQ